MLNRYEALFIFPESLKDDELEAAVGRVRDEIKKAGGEIESTTRLGKRAFARRLKKKEAGHYVIVTCKMDGNEIRPLLARYRLNSDVFRVQWVRAGETAAAGAATEAKGHGVTE
jgi:ribosomal protein S6